MNYEMWNNEFPERVGYYWFYGWRFGYKKGFQDEYPKPELHVVKVRRASNGFVYICSGNFMYESDGVGFWKELPSPCLPDYSDVDDYVANLT